MRCMKLASCSWDPMGHMNRLVCLASYGPPSRLRDHLWVHQPEDAVKMNTFMLNLSSYEACMLARFGDRFQAKHRYVQGHWRRNMHTDWA